MVNTEIKRKRCFLQGLNGEIQDTLVTTRVETYIEIVEMAQRVEDSKARVKELYNARRAGTRTWGQQRGGPSQGSPRPPQRATGGMPQKRIGRTGILSPVKCSATAV